MGEEWDVRDPENILGEEYESRGAEFPFERVERITAFWHVSVGSVRHFDEPRVVRDFKCDEKEVFDWWLGVLRLRVFLEQNETVWKEDYPDLNDGLWFVYEKLGSAMSEARERNLYPKIVEALEQHGWVWDRHADELKAAQTDGAGNRPRLLKNELICLMYDCLRPAFDVGWPDCAGTKNPQALRDHISQLFSYGVPNDETDPRPNGPIYRAIHNHLKN